MYELLFLIYSLFIHKFIFHIKSPMVTFAGEATIEEHYSTVHGAYLSGIRESDRILAHFKN
jgi:hypothetical protein